MGTGGGAPGATNFTPDEEKVLSIIGKTASEGISGGIGLRGDEGLSENRRAWRRRSHLGAEWRHTRPQERTTPHTIEPCPRAPTSRAQCPHVGRPNRAAPHNNLHLQRNAGASLEGETGGAAGDRGPTGETACPPGGDGADPTPEVRAAPETAGTCRGAVQPSLHLGPNNSPPARKPSGFAHGDAVG